MFLHAYWSLGDNFDHLQYAYSERCDCISNETQFPPVVFWRLPFPRTGRGFRVFSVNKISGHIWVKLRRHYPHFALARMFGISVFTVQNVFVTWINFCYYQWQEINWWPERRLVQRYCPADFKRVSHYQSGCGCYRGPGETAIKSTSTKSKFLLATNTATQ